MRILKKLAAKRRKKRKKENNGIFESFALLCGNKKI
jgi:hypothetical protein